MNARTIIQKLSIEYNLPIQKIEEAIYYQFKYTNQVMRKGEFEGVRLPYFGKFHVNPGRIKHLNERTSNRSRK